MKKIYLALMCMASFALMTACGGDKKGDKADSEEKEKTEVTNEEQPNDEGQEATTENTENVDENNEWGIPANAQPLDHAALYANGKFQPAMNVIFEDDLSGETADELPSKWNINAGSAQVGETETGKYIALTGGDCVIMPLVDGGSKAFLPENYTVEFDFMFGNDVYFNIFFSNADEENITNFDIRLYNVNWTYKKNDDEWPSSYLDGAEKILKKAGWNHFAVSYENGNMKLFLNGQQQAILQGAVPATYFTIRGFDANGSNHYITNVRVCK